MPVDALGWIAVSILGSVPGLVMRSAIVAAFGFYLTVGVLALETGDTGAMAVFLLASVAVFGAGANTAIGLLTGGG